MHIRIIKEKERKKKEMEVIMESHPALESISRKGDLHSINKCLST
jgi:hypothetical protein